MHWKPTHLLKRLGASPEINSWMSTPGSLTQRIRQACPEMQVQILSEGWQIPLASEAQRLGLPDCRKAWIRCVLLKCQQQSWVYARTVIPDMRPGSPWFSLQKLGSQPLGEVLFELKNLQRSPFEWSRNPLQAWPLIEQALTKSMPLAFTETSYARRSLFTRQYSPLLLTEVFLPDLILNHASKDS
ncbi:chorismate lyase [Thiomicrorhabdus sp. zzn3]|uniref:chorismate--pyruvate lyase family protein n=1 Tax=Thiomicrorhabdus sp. zzn3 TaxID=3039775 RepID=UPI002436F1BC|nr:chorismate lyase [Thiomicrorhabdus sp. zzn3]MDG6778698.1 chorismate lyase [Thiomicrorhabdus sp. zzn3]